MAEDSGDVIQDRPILPTTDQLTLSKPKAYIPKPTIAPTIVSVSYTHLTLPTSNGV